MKSQEKSSPTHSETHQTESPSFSSPQTHDADMDVGGSNTSNVPLEEEELVYDVELCCTLFVSIFFFRMLEGRILSPSRIDLIFQYS